MSLRADFFGELQKDEPLFGVHRLINVPPLREAQLRVGVRRPANELSSRFETDHLPQDIARRTAEQSAKDAGALPLLSYLLDDMWPQMVRRGDGVLRLSAQSIDLGRVLVDRADKFIADHPDSEDTLRRIFTLKLATVRRPDPTACNAFRLASCRRAQLEKDGDGDRPSSQTHLCRDKRGMIGGDVSDHALPSVTATNLVVSPDSHVDAFEDQRKG
jgi:hypothetical protein